MDFYKILDVTKNATMSEIKMAFKRLALVYHPDKNKGCECPKFIEIKKAYDILSDPIQRQIYDDTLTKSSIGHIADWKKFMRDVMSEMYVMFTMYIIPKNVELNINIEFVDVYFKKVKKIDVRVKRWIDEKFTDYIKSIYISLNNFKATHIFQNEGDDSILTNKPRSDIIVNLKIVNIPENVTIQDIFCPFDLYIVKNITLSEYFLNKTFTINICQGVETEILNNVGELSYICKDLGLPFVDMDTKVNVRGDIYIHLNITFPIVSVNEEFKKYLLKYFGNDKSSVVLSLDN